MTIKQPSNKSQFILPDLGEGVHEAELIKWRVKPGDTVEEHQTLAEMETDKALVEVPSPWAGRIQKLHGNEGEILNVGSVLVTYDTSKSTERTPAPVANGKAVDEVNPAANANTERKDAGTVVGSVGEALTVPARFTRRTTEANGPMSRTKVLATPAVRRIARETGIDINQISGSGRGGRVTASDIQQSIAGMGAPTRSTSSHKTDLTDILHSPTVRTTHSADGISQRIPFRGVRRKIAESLRHSINTAAHFSVFNEADVTQLDRKRLEYASLIGGKLSFLPFILSAVCKALRQHPALNANVDDENAEILLKDVIHLGIAVDTDNGLMVPVIDHADQMSIVQLSEAVRDVAVACRNRTIERTHLMGGTFTISNVGSYGGMFATPIINYPEVAILAAGRVYEKVLTKDGMFYAGKVLPLSLSCDHRVVDGAEGARFVSTMVKLLEDPESLVQ